MAFCGTLSAKFSLPSSSPSTNLSSFKPNSVNLPCFRLFFYSNDTRQSKTPSSLTIHSNLPRLINSLQTNQSLSTTTFTPQTIGKRTDLKKIMILGAGPIIIGQACEFDYSGTQACKALKEEGYQVVLVNSNPATIMTDPELADRTYITPMTPELVEQILEKERPDALLPTMGGQTALNLAVALAESGALERYGIELIGAKLDAIHKAEDRDLFKQAMKNIGIKTPPSGVGTTLEECNEIAKLIGEFPLIIRPAFTLGGTGGGIAYNKEEFESICKSGLAASLTSQVCLFPLLLVFRLWVKYFIRKGKEQNAKFSCSQKIMESLEQKQRRLLTLNMVIIWDFTGSR